MATVTVESKPGHAFTTTVTGASLHFIADEPTTFGGDDLGPTPYELLLASLGTCTAMTIASYARRQSWPLSSIAIRLTHDRVHGEDCQADEQPAARVDRIRREIDLQGELDAQQRTRLLDIATKCPVHRTLTNDIQIENISAHA